MSKIIDGQFKKFKYHRPLNFAMNVCILVFFMAYETRNNKEYIVCNTYIVDEKQIKHCEAYSSAM